MNLSKIRLTAKFMLGVAAILAVTLTANLIITNSHVNEQANEAFTDKLRQITGMALTVRDWSAEHQKIYRSDEQSEGGKRDIASVPVVQAWQITQDYANSMNIEFRTPSLSPRNPDNMAVGFEREALLAFQSDHSLKEFVKREEESNGQEYVHFAVPVYLGKSCLECHGFPKGELDPFGFAKEGMSEGDLRAAFVLKANAATLLANEAANTQFMIWSTLIIMTLVCGVIYWFTRKMVVGPIGKVVGVTDKMTDDFDKLALVVDGIANNDLTRSFEETELEALNINTEDEIGDMARSVERMMNSKRKIGASMNQMTSSLRNTIGNVSKTSESLLSAATEISSSAEQMANGAKQQTDQTTQVSTAVEEMTATVIETSKNAEEASTISRQASEMASVGAEVVTETIAGMQRIASVVSNSAATIGELAKSADHIGEIIGVIDDIADQTNLLALNAAIEAARAGEQGRGFAVVADEVRKLAERTTKATAEITGMIKGIQRDTSDAVKSMEEGTIEVNTGRELADKAGDSLNEILNMSQRVNNMIQQIATAAEEQSAAAEEISRNVDQIANVTQETAKGASESAFASEDLSKQAEGLTRIVSEFKV